MMYIIYVIVGALILAITSWLLSIIGKFITKEKDAMTNVFAGMAAITVIFGILMISYLFGYLFFQLIGAK